MATRTWTPLEHWIARFLAVLLLGFTVFLTVWGISEVRKDERLDEVGVEVPAEVVSASVDTSSDSTTTDLVVRYVQRGDARTVTTAEITYDGDFVEDNPGARRTGIRIEYDPDDPQLVRLAGGGRDLGIELLVGAGVSAAVGGFIAALALRAWLRERTV